MRMAFVDSASLLIVQGPGIRTIADLAGRRIGVVPRATAAYDAA
jgi:ABC-type nitrate/sulfonate/bicarbonate transport system substrate-binding protein